eukprot:gene38986-43377_t
MAMTQQHPKHRAQLEPDDRITQQFTVDVAYLVTKRNRVHFGGWCIVSSPLILAFNLREFVWDVITNKEAIQIVSGAGSNHAVEAWVKPVGEGRVAVFLINTLNKAAKPYPNATVSIKLSALNITENVKVRDVWAKSDLAPLKAGSSLDAELEFHGSQFY